jgi:hypothetical protein
LGSFFFFPIRQNEESPTVAVTDKTAIKRENWLNLFTTPETLLSLFSVKKLPIAKQFDWRSFLLLLLLAFAF